MNVTISRLATRLGLFAAGRAFILASIVILGLSDAAFSQGIWRCQWAFDEIYFSAEKGGPLPEPITVPFTCFGSCDLSHVDVVDLPSWLSCERIGNAYRFQVNTTDLPAPIIYGGHSHLDAMPCAVGQVHQYANLFSRYRLSPVAQLRLTAIRVIKGDTDTTYSPHDLPGLEVGDRLYVSGLARDEFGVPRIGASIRCYVPIDGVQTSGDSAIYYVSTDSAGRFVFPDTTIAPNGIECTTSNVYGLWFGLDTIGMPLLVGVRDLSGGRDCLLDSMVNWASVLDLPVGTGIGVPDTTNLLSWSFPAYPLIDEYLGWEANDQFFQGYLFCYNGNVDVPFVAEWLERGLLLFQPRLDQFSLGMKEQLRAGTGSVQMLAERTDRGWTAYDDPATAPTRDIGSWLVGVCLPECAWSGMTEYATIGYPGTWGKAVFRVAPLVLSVVDSSCYPRRDMPWVCESNLSALSSTPCQATGGSAADLATIVTPPKRIGGLALDNYTQWLEQPRNRLYDRLHGAITLLNDVRTYAARSGEYFSTAHAVPVYVTQPGIGEIRSFGWNDLEYSNPMSLACDNAELQALAIIRDAPNMAVQSSFDDLSHPTILTVTVTPDRSLYQAGTTKYAAPSISIDHGELHQPLTVTSNHSTRIYSAQVPITSIPEYVEGESYVGEIVVEGTDIHGNVGCDTVVLGFGHYSGDSLTLKSSIGEGILIPDSGSIGSVMIAINTLSASPGAARTISDSIAVQSAIGTLLCVSPDTLQLSIQAEIVVRLGNDFRSVEGTACNASLGHWNNLTGEWDLLPFTFDSTALLLTGSSSTLGVFAPVMSYNVSCCEGTAGNVNLAGIVDLADLSALVSYLTGGGFVLPCTIEANVNGGGIVDLSDLSSLVSYLTGGGFALPNCP